MTEKQEPTEPRRDSLIWALWIIIILSFASCVFMMFEARK